MYSRLKEHLQTQKQVRLYLHLTGTRNNIILCLTAERGFVFSTWSMGVAGLVGYKKTTFASGTLFAVHFGDRLALQLRRLKARNYDIELVLHGARHLKQFTGFLAGLASTALFFHRIQNYYRLPFNGSRPRARRRV